MNQPRDFVLPTGPTSGPIQVGNHNQLIFNQQTTIINNLNNLLDSFDSPHFEAKLIKVDEEFQKLFNSLDSQQRDDLKAQAEEIIAGKTSQKGFKEKIKQFSKFAAAEGWDIAKNVLINILSGAATKP